LRAIADFTKAQEPLQAEQHRDAMKVGQKPKLSTLSTTSVRGLIEMRVSSSPLATLAL
jgi:hypothetical protein